MDASDFTDHFYLISCQSWSLLCNKSQYETVPVCTAFTNNFRKP